MDSVAMYQSKDAKREITRLEKSARAAMQRDIASHGALAVLYGPHSRHYIQKPEVDIGLGKLGRTNQISRRQAIIKLDESGEFHLKNLGKSSIFVDGKEVHPGQSLVLHSNCLIEVREFQFIFENSQAQVKQYLDDVSRRTPTN